MKFSVFFLDQCTKLWRKAFRSNDKQPVGQDSQPEDQDKPQPANFLSGVLGMLKSKQGVANPKKIASQEPLSSPDNDRDQTSMDQGIEDIGLGDHETGTIVLDPRQGLFYFCPLNNPTFECNAFAAMICQEKTNYIAERVAKRLNLTLAKGDKYEFLWQLLEKEPTPKTRRSKFEVAPDDVMKVEVALGTEWEVGEVLEDQSNTTSSNHFHEQPPNRDGDSTALIAQDQRLIRERGLQSILYHYHPLIHIMITSSSPPIPLIPSEPRALNGFRDLYGNPQMIRRSLST